MPTKPRPNTIQSLVKWMVARGSSVLDILGRATEKYPKGRLDKLPEYINTWTQALGKQIQVNEPISLTDRQRRNLALEGYTPGFQRTTVDFTWINPKTGLVEDRTYSIDIPANARGNARANAIANGLANILSASYGNQIVTQRDLLKFVLNYKERRGEE